MQFRLRIPGEAIGTALLQDHEHEEQDGQGPLPQGDAWSRGASGGGGGGGGSAQGEAESRMGPTSVNSFMWMAFYICV